MAVSSGLWRVLCNDYAPNEFNYLQTIRTPLARQMDLYRRANRVIRQRMFGFTLV